MRIIIAGSRDFNDYKLLEKECNRIFKQLADEGLVSYFVEDSQKEIEIISGTANGADKLGERFAQNYGLKLIRFPANWDAYGKRAGYLRNEQMAKYASEVCSCALIAFWDGQSKGTKHMIDLANKHGVRVFIVNYKEAMGEIE